MAVDGNVGQKIDEYMELDAVVVLYVGNIFGE